jgi:hypothetical protein
MIICAGTIKAQAVKMFKDVEIKTSVVEDPGFSSGNVKQYPVGKNQRWIELDVNYTTASSMDKTGDPRWVSDVVMKYDVLLPRVSGRPRVVLSGKVQYWAIALDGKIHHAQTFIHPRILQRFVPGLKLNNSALKDLRVMITFELNESPVGIGVLKLRGKAKGKSVASEIKRALSSPATKKVKDSVFSRDLTPWSIINLGYYELIKQKNK